jgi:endonuclease-3
MEETIIQKKKRALKIFNIMITEYPDAKCHLNYKNPFQLLISTILAAQCTDERVNHVMDNLYKKYKTPSDIAKANSSQLEKELNSINFYRNKTKSIQNCCRMIVDDFGGKVPQTMEELTKLAGVGRKSANVVLGNCFGQPAIMTDTHVIRVSQRLGLAESDKPDKLEMELKAIIPDENQTKYSLTIGEHGRQICKAKKPLCLECVINKYCPSFKIFYKNI